MLPVDSCLMAVGIICLGNVIIFDVRSTNALCKFCISQFIPAIIFEMHLFSCVGYLQCIIWVSNLYLVCDEGHFSVCPWVIRGSSPQSASTAVCVHYCFRFPKFFASCFHFNNRFFSILFAIIGEQLLFSSPHLMDFSSSHFVFPSQFLQLSMPLTFTSTQRFQ